MKNIYEKGFFNVLFTNSQIIAISDNLSYPRFSTYLRYCNNNNHNALELYYWNLEMSSAFIVPLHFFEICLRNAVIGILKQVHGSNWVSEIGFINSLPQSRKTDLQNARHQNIDQAITKLTFIFWEQMFTQRHDHSLWQHHIQNIFPNSCEINYIDIRRIVYAGMAKIRQLRNRIAHHEPIFNRNLEDDYKIIHEILFWRNKEIANWLESVQAISTILKKKPII